MREETILNAINDLDSINCMIQDIHESIYQDTPDYWTRLEHQYAGMAMQGILGSEEIMMRINKMPIKEDKFGLVIAELSTNIAHALVEKLKEKEERKRDKH